MREERRIVTALFADVVRSTALAERLDPEEFKLVVDGAISRAVHSIDAYGGTVKNLIGDGVLALFGAPVAHEDDPERAIRAALQLIESIRQYAGEVLQSWGIEDFAMRVGIDMGEVVVWEVGAGSLPRYDAVGDAVNTAARLQSRAAAGTVLVSEGARRSTAAVFEWGEPVTLELTGRRQAVAAYPLRGLTGTSTREAVAPMIGRETELATGVRVIEGLASGRGSVLFIVGEPGIGKSRLVAELRQRALAQWGCTWLEGRCVSYGDALPYWPYRDLLRSWLQVSVAEPELRLRVKLRRRLDDVFLFRGSEVYPYFGAVLGLNIELEAAAQLAPLAPEPLQYRTFEVFESLVTRLAKVRPVVISLEDLHWGDPTSLALTERLIGLSESAPVMVIISQRAETDHASWGLKEKAEREYRHVFHELVLQPLQPESQTELLRSLLGTRVLPVEVSDAVMGYAEGNPFYLEQLIRSLLDRDLLVPEGGSARPAKSMLAIPQTLEGVIIARIDRLEPSWREVVTAASVLGRTFGLELLEALTGLDVPVLRAAIHHLRRLDLLREDISGGNTAYRFTHALIQAAAYRTLVAERRQGLHRRAAEWFESFYKGRLESIYGLLAHHWLNAADLGKAAHYLKLAGDRARDEWALDEAIDHYRALVPLLEKSGRKHEVAELLFQLATALHFAMRYREANEVWQQAFQEWTPTPLPDEPPPTATLVLASSPIPWDPDPQPNVFRWYPNTVLTAQLYDRLLTPRPGGYLLPSLADRWEVTDDGLRYRFRLAPNLTWSDGQPLTAEDVVFSVRRALDRSRGGPFGSRLSVLENAEAYVAGAMADVTRLGVRALNRRLVEFRLHRPAPNFLQILSQYALIIRSDLATTGPFVLSELATERLIIERDPGYPRPVRGNVARVVWRDLGGEAARSALARGEVDAIMTGSQDPARHGISDSETQALVGPPWMTSWLNFGRSDRHPSDVSFRKAIAHATDRRRLESLLLPGQTIASGGLVPPGLSGHTPDAALPFDPDAARRYLAASAYQSVFTVAVRSPSRPVYWEVLEECWREVLGLETQLIEFPVAQPANMEESGHAYFINWVSSTPDAEHFLRVGFHSSSRELSRWWSSSAFDALINRALAERSGARRLALFHEADRMLVREECIVIPLTYGRDIVLLKPWVHGWWVWGPPPLSFGELTVDERSPRSGKTRQPAPAC